MDIQNTQELLLKDTNGIPLTLKKGSFTPHQVKSDSALADFKNKSLYSIVKNLKITDEAFINSILSFSVYEENEWMGSNLKKGLPEMSSYLEKAFEDKDEMYKMKIWHFMKNTFEKVPDNKIKIPAQHMVLNAYQYVTSFYYKDGEYSANNGLAHASILTSKNPNGDGNILHLSFRGTEFSRIKEYLKGPYLDMTAYYQHFEPLEKYIKEFVSNPDNKIDELHVNGHSLGGAMVQEFLKNNKKEDFPVPIKGFTFGSPGSEKKWYHQLFTLAYHTLVRGVNIPLKNIEFQDKHLKKDNRLHEFYHSNDPVPKVGLLGYQKNGEGYNLFDTLHQESKSAKLENNSFLEKTPVFGRMITAFKEKYLNQFNKKFHNSGRYIMNIRSLIEEHYSVYPEIGMTIKDNSKHWENWIIQEKKFSSLSIKLKGDFEYLVEKNNPELTKIEINDKILQIREKMKYDSQAELVLAKTRRNNQLYDQYFSSTHKVMQLNENIKSENISDNITIPTKQKLQVLRKIYEEGMEERTKVLKNRN